MTLNELYRKGCSILNENNIDDAEFDARYLAEFALNISTTDFFLQRENDIDVSIQDAYFALIERRLKGEPLQYIIGKWEFMGNELFVGEGVLIPRPETELLVETAQNFLKNKKNPIVFDLCSGSGCIAVSIAKLFPEAKVYAVEKYEKAYSYLIKNIKHNGVTNVTAVNGDLFDENILSEITPDVILSNPPYIRTDDIQTLDITVRNEPHTALDGGNDGYVFYRYLADFWFSQRLKYDSAMILECGEDQGDTIASLLSPYTEDVEVINDFNDLQRIVFAKK